MNWLISCLPFAALGMLAAGPAIAAEEGQIIGKDQIKWMAAPPSLLPGSEIAVLSGDPSKSGDFVIELRGPQGYTVPPHWHSTAEHVTVITGNFTVGMGDAVASGAGTELGPGGFASLPAQMHHWARAGSPFVIEVAAAGPFDIHYIHPEDNPDKQAAK